MSFDPDLLDIWRTLDRAVPGDLEQEWCTSPDYYPVYRSIGRSLQPGSIFEIGTRVGHSLISMAVDNPRLRRVRWVDIESFVSGSNMLASANLTGFYRRYRADWLPEIECSRTYPVRAAVRGRYDLCHIDGDHSFAGKIRDLDFCASINPLWIIVDDYDFIPAVASATRQWCRRYGHSLYRVQSYRGLALIPLHKPMESTTIQTLREQGQLEVSPIQVR